MLSIKDLRQKDDREQLSDFTKPSDSSKTISRKAMDMKFLVLTIIVFG